MAEGEMGRIRDREARQREIRHGHGEIDAAAVRCERVEWCVIFVTIPCLSRLNHTYSSRFVRPVSASLSIGGLAGGALAITAQHCFARYGLADVHRN